MFGFILISIITGMHLYVFWRMGTTQPFARRLSPRVQGIFGTALWSLFVAGRIFGHGQTGAVAQGLEFLGMNWMATLFLVFTCLFISELITGLGWVIPKTAPYVRVAAFMTGLILSGVALVQGMRAPEVTGYEVALKELPGDLDGTRIVALSDLHLGGLLGEKWLDARVTQVLAEKPDMVFLVGDLFEGHGEPIDPFLPALRRLADASLGVWVVPGNHEFHGRSNSAVTLVQRAGFHLLRNTAEVAVPGLVVAGVDDLTYLRRTRENTDPVMRALSGRPSGATILLSHTPWEAERAAGQGTGLMISGHTHGGQVWPFGYLVRQVYPYFTGRYQVQGMTLIVGRGTGTWGPRMRLWKPGEILRIELKGESVEPPS